MPAKTTTRQDIWQAAVTVLTKHHGDEQARKLASEIVDLYSGKRREVVAAHRVSPETEQQIKRLLLERAVSMMGIAKSVGVGTSTVQRVAEELREQGLLPHTSMHTINAVRE